MSKNITILEGSTSKQFGNAKKLRTNMSGGGTCDWVPEDEVQLTTKHITENGTYIAADEGYYGYSQVTVNGIGGTTYTAQDGDQLGGDPLLPAEDYYIDEYGNVVLLPSAIGFTLPPSKLNYENGEHIVLTGANVRAYRNDGVTWESSDYPGGIVPLSELTIVPATADYSQSSGESHAISDLFNKEIYFKKDSAQTIRNYPRRHYVVMGASFAVGPSSGGCWFIAAASEPLTGRYYKKQLGGQITDDRPYSLAGSYTYDNKTVYYNTHASSADTSYDVPNNEGITFNEWQNNHGKMAWTMIYGTITASGEAEIAVKWNRPYDGKELATTFDIQINSGETTSESEFEGGGGGHDI